MYAEAGGWLQVSFSVSHHLTEGDEASHLNLELVGFLSLARQLALRIYLSHLPSTGLIGSCHSCPGWMQVLGPLGVYRKRKLNLVKYSKPKEKNNNMKLTEIRIWEELGGMEG